MFDTKKLPSLDELDKSAQRSDVFLTYVAFHLPILLSKLLVIYQKEKQEGLINFRPNYLNCKRGLCL